ncbi:hypothetical protein [Amycolatopsis marina]|uniref:hypothetical protein n=1 Tax=Amycolatopsis marina TaxID=490629 RepID=UPI0015A5E25C|nr:hypothetical protein [Amycolatopsis marina]
MNAADQPPDPAHQRHQQQTRPGSWGVVAVVLAVVRILDELQRCCDAEEGSKWTDDHGLISLSTSHNPPHKRNLSQLT